MPLFMVNKEVFEWMNTGKETIELRKRARSNRHIAREMVVAHGYEDLIHRIAIVKCGLSYVS
jgi:hypothetical protein